MAEEKKYRVRIKFPGDLEYIPAVRKFVSEMLQVNHFSPKFAFRSEIIVDEICNNAVTYGCQAPGSSVDIACLICGDRIEFQIKDAGGTKEDLERLKAAMAAEDKAARKAAEKSPGSGLGLEIVRMLSEEVDLEVDENNLTSIRVVRRREDLKEKKKSSA
jgi:anti-sigma regulatory factor (Ser/Thr protein kinase)